jgi:hypothetical protein
VDLLLAVLTLLAQRKLAWSWSSVRATLDANKPPGDDGQIVTPRLALVGGGHVQVIHYPESAPPDPLTT